MTVGLVGRKCGMTRVFSEDGISTPVTVVEVEPNTITQLKTAEKDGYIALQITTGKKKLKKVTKPLAGHFKKANVEAGRGLWEFRLENDKVFSKKELKVGDVIAINDVFKEGQMVDVSGVTKGKGYAGTIKRHHFHHQDFTHGNSVSHRVPGSIGQNQTPGRVFKGHKMAGHLGVKNRTIQNQKIVKIDAEKNLLLVQGVIPGVPGGDVIITPSVKAKGE